ncbi:Dihydropteroate synthase [Candidatus Nitrosotalea sp. TS]|uniref:dihydropteroate synthase n=1 Tax=Candidatus Nitrosotalea sp. TS TaxID=2341020 RepID=UPI00140BF256|nr:dihydropteroate synthase [Candidatus Nitrosotalea sp. TS]NHI04631.1 Dihydropteroate synthase [Candidatus Nitrosotalea sp. TS]
MNKLGPVPVGNSNPTRIMGIINTSPESFYKKSVHTEPKEIAKIAKQMEEDGANFIDIGGMSTAPYLKTLVPEKTEIDRITKAISAVQKVSKLPVSIDTCRANVAKKAFELGVEILNDVTGLQYDQNMTGILEEYSPSVIVCAFSKQPITGNQITHTRNLLAKSISIAKKSGILKNKIVVDPAIGFFRKNAKGVLFTKINSDWLQRDIDIIRNLSSIKLGYPMLVSVSRKSFIGYLLNENDPDKRLYGSLAAEAIAVLNGANIIRTHNVKATCDVIEITKNLYDPRKAYNRL